MQAQRRAKLSQDLDTVCASEGGWSNDWAFAHVGGAQNHNPVPYWSWRPLCPGEWRERAGGSEGRGEALATVHLMRPRASYGERMRTLATAAGSFWTLLNLGWGRYIGPKPCMSGRVGERDGDHDWGGLN